MAYAITVPADSGALTSGMTMAADPRLPRRHDGHAFDRRLQPVGAGRLGASASRWMLPADRQSATAWTAAFAVLAAGILLGPVALYWSRRTSLRHEHAPLPIILALGTTQTLAWASSYYLPAILADPIARDLGVSSNWIFAAFSASLVISALLGPRIGRQIDLVGGRPVLSMSNLTLAAGLVLLGFTYSIPVLIIAWLLLGIGMAARPLRRGLRRARAHLWRRGAALDHRHHADCGICLDRRMAADGAGGWKPSAGATPALPGRRRIS